MAIVCCANFRRRPKRQKDLFRAGIENNRGDLQGHQKANLLAYVVHRCGVTVLVEILGLISSADCWIDISRALNLGPFLCFSLGQ